MMKHNFCFVCNECNEKGLNVCFKGNGEKVEGSFIPRKEHQSYTDITHGGILTSLLDAAMNRAVQERRLIALTGRLEIRFLQTAQIGSPLKIVGEVTKMRKKFALTKAEIFSPSGSMVASSKGIFLIKGKTDIN